MSFYYIFEPACNTVETGSQFPQVQKMSPGYDYKASNSVYALSRAVEKFPDFLPNLDYLIVHGKANLTDLLSTSPISGGFLISERFKQLLEKFNLAPHKFYPARVSYKKEFHDYYWLHIICNFPDSVDYKKSTFFTYHNYNHNLGNITINSKQDFIQKKQKIKQDNPGKTITLWSQKIILNSNFNQDIDLFEIGTFDSNYYISGRIKSAIEFEKITGCEIRPAPDLITQ